MNPLTQSKNTIVLIALALAWLALSPGVRATCQEGCLLSSNTALGDDVLLNNRTGVSNTGIGFMALLNNNAGSFNTATGNGALFANTTGGNNTAIGFDALFSNKTGSHNTATGFLALASNTIGIDNTANGHLALNSNTTGRNNMAVGWKALFTNSTGNFNIAVGDGAGFKLTTGSNNIDIGNAGVADESDTIRIGTVGTQSATFIAGISGATVPTGVAVIVDADGHLGTTTSSARFKEAIKPMDKASEAILSLKPVTFRYKKELDSERIPQFGLVAEEVEKVSPDLVARDEQGRPYTVRYEAVNAMLLNEFLKEHRTVQEQKATIAELKHNFAEQQQQIEALTADLQRLSVQLKVSHPWPQRMAVNDQ